MSDEDRIARMEKVMAGEQGSGRYCINCVNFAPNDVFPLSGICRRTNVSLIDGSPIEIGQTAYDQRYHDGPGYCGSGAIFWRPRLDLLVPTIMNPAMAGNVSEDDGA